MQATTAPLGTTAASFSRPLLLERALLFTISCSLIGDYCGGNLPVTDVRAHAQCAGGVQCIVCARGWRRPPFLSTLVALQILTPPRTPFSSCPQAWAFFTLLSLYLAASQHRPIVIAFAFGCITLFSDILFLAIVRARLALCLSPPWGTPAPSCG